MKSNKVAYSLIVPYYFFGALAFLSLGVILSGIRLPGDLHFAHPGVIAAVHVITLGWASMLIFGAGHQLAPVILNGPLYSTKLLKLNFYCAAAGIPLIITGLYQFNFNVLTITGAVLMTISAISFAINLFMTAHRTQAGKTQALFMKAASLWLIVTCTLGLLQAINFNHFILPFDSFRLLNTHAHAGLIGFIATMVVGVSSKLMPMFTLSKYQDELKLKIIFTLIHIGLLCYILSEVMDGASVYFSVFVFLLAIGMFLHYNWNVFRHRMKRQIDFPLKGALGFHVALVPLASIGILPFADTMDGNKLKLLYGILWLLGAIGSILIGMTYKTLPFMAWNERPDKNRNIMPKDLYNQNLLKVLTILYLSGVLSLCFGIISGQAMVYRLSSILLISSALIHLYMTYKIHAYTH